MLRRTVVLTTLLVLCGVMALSVPAYADRNPQPTKAATSTAVGVKATAATISPGSGSAHAYLKDGLRFWLRHWLGLPPIPTETKPTESTEPLKSVGEKGNANNWTGKPMVTEVDQDHGGSNDEM